MDKTLLRSCPICKNASKGEVLHTQAFVLPEGHILSAAAKYDVVSCSECGFVFADTPVGQDVYDRYYSQMSIYEMDYGALDISKHMSQAKLIGSFLNDENAKIVDMGCGNGGLEWTQVRREIEQALGEMAGVDVLVYEPVSDYQNAPKREGVEELTPARAMIAELVRRYWVLGIECSNLEVQKLAWFLQRVIEEMGLPNPLGLKFQPHKYGPYSDQLRHLLNGLDGSYLHCEKRLADASPYDVIWFEESRRSAVQAYLNSDEARSYLPALEETSRIIDGFESPLGMELLSSVDWLLTVDKSPANVEALGDAIGRWPGGREAAARKRKLFGRQLLQVALGRLSPPIAA